MHELYKSIDNAGLLLPGGLLLFCLLWETVLPFAGFFRGRGNDRVLHGYRNLVLGLMNSIAVSFIFISLWRWAISSPGFPLP